MVLFFFLGGGGVQVSIIQTKWNQRDFMSKILTPMIQYILIGQGWGAGKFFIGSGSWLFLQAAPALAPDFFWAAPAPVFFQAAPAQAPRSQNIRLRLPSPVNQYFILRINHQWMRHFCIYSLPRKTNNYIYYLVIYCILSSHINSSCSMTAFFFSFLSSYFIWNERETIFCGWRRVKEGDIWSQNNVFFYRNNGRLMDFYYNIEVFSICILQLNMK